jgi:hypothetical protein
VHVHTQALRGELEEKQLNHWFALNSTAYSQRLYVPALVPVA